MTKLSLLEQAVIEERREELKANKITPDSTGTEILKILLPNYEPLNDNAIAYHNSRVRECKLHGGVRGGKTIPECAEAIKLSYVNRPYAHVEWSNTQENAEVTISKEIKKLLKDNAVKFKYTKSEGHFEIYWGEDEKDIAHIYSWGVLTFIKGTTFASSGYNEAYSIPREQYLVAEERASLEVPGGWFKKTTAGTCEPRKMNWGHEEYQKPDVISDTEFKVTFTTDGNKYLSEAYKRELREKYSPEEQAVYMDGIYTNLAQGRTYSSFVHQKHIGSYSKYLEEERGSEVYRIILGFDFNYNPMTCTLWDLKGRKRRQINEYKLSNSNTDELCKYIVYDLKEFFPGIADVENKLNYSVYITGDASGNQHRSSGFGENDHDIIKRIFFSSGMNVNIHFDNSNLLVKERVNIVNGLFDKDLIEIFDNCKDSIKDRELSKWKEGSNKFIVDKSDKSRSHLNDGGDYALLLTARMGIDNVESSDGGSDLIFGAKRRN